VAGHGLQTYSGGKGANQAVATARFGSDVYLIAKIGHDEFADINMSALVDNSVNVDGVSRHEQFPTGVALIFVDARGENMIAVAGGANDRLTAKDVESAWTSPVAAVLAVLESPVAAIQSGFDMAKASNAITILNAAPPAQVNDELLSRTDYLIVNQTEAGAILNRDVAGVNLSMTDAVDLRSRIRRGAIITLGPDGAVFAGDSDPIRVPSPRVDAVDATAAGDAFCGAFAVAMSEGNSEVHSLRFAAAAGSVAVTRAGAQPSLPTRREVEQALETNQIP
jgi:ribokinase